MLVTPVSPKVSLHVHFMDGIEGRIRDKAREAWKLSTVKIGLASAFVWAIMPEVANQWSSMAPFILHYFPKAGENVAPFIGSILFILARVSKFEFVHKVRDDQS